MTRAAATRRLLRLALVHPVAVVATAAIVTLVGVALASRLTIETDLTELLPPRAPSVLALHALERRVTGTGNVAIAIESVDGSPDPLRRYMPRLAAALREELGSAVLSLRFSRQATTDYFQRFAAYYIPLPELTRWSRALATALAKQNPAYVELDDTSGAALGTFVDEVRASRAKLVPNNAADDRTGLLMTEGGRLGVVFVRPAADSLDLAGSRSMMDRIERIVAATGPTAAGVRIAGYTGSIPLALTEVEAIESDIISTAILVVVGVGGVVMLFFRGVRELAMLFATVVMGTAVALGFAELWIGHVNAQTAFLGAIIAGTGINYGVILLDRYRQARAVGETVDDALAVACDETARATGIAAIATAISFGVLAAGEIESFHQFGWIGGIGIATCWVATFTVMPACLVLTGRRHTPRPAYRAINGGFRRLAEGCARAPRPALTVALALGAASVALAIGARHEVVETDLRKLGTRSAGTSGIETLDNRLRAMDDRSSTPAVIATESREETRPVCDLLNTRAHGDLNGIVRRCYAVDDLLPTDLDDRSPVISRLRHDLDAVDDDSLTPAERDAIEDATRALAEPPPTVADLPRELAEIFTEHDGSMGKLAYVEPNNEHIEHNLYAFTDAIRSITLPSGKVIESSGELVVFADVLRAMRRDAIRLTIAAALLVLLVVGVVTHRAGSFVRVGTALVTGVAVMLGVAVVLGQKLNFFNFVALPTTFGIGVDYAINIDERIARRGRHALPAALVEAGPAVVLASLTSMIGYASLLVADSQALVSFGALAIIGEIACVTMALVVVPALWAMQR